MILYSLWAGKYPVASCGLLCLTVVLNISKMSGMAHLIRVKSTRWILNGVQVPAGTLNATKQTTVVKKWYGANIPGLPKSKRVPLAISKKASQRMLDDLVRSFEEGRAGLPNPEAAAKSLQEHLNAYREAVKLGLLSNRKPCDDHANTTARYPFAVFVEGLNYSLLSDFGPNTAKAVAVYLEAQMSSKKWSAQTAKFHLAGARRFLVWLREQRAPIDPAILDTVPAPDAKNNRVHLRRPCGPGELARILEAARTGRSSYGLTGVQRYHLYLLASATGYRLNELSQLTVQSFDLTTTNASVALPGRSTKNKRVARQPIPPDVADQFREFLKDREPTEPVWPRRSWAHFGAWMLQVDLEVAGIPYKLDTPNGPTYLDFHSLRHTYVTSLAEAGASPKELQELARHSDSRTTAEIYTHANPSALRDVVSRLNLTTNATDATPTPENVTTLVWLLGTVLGEILTPRIHPGIHSDCGGPWQTVANCGENTDCDTSYQNDSNLPKK